MADEDQDRTEPATPYKREEARRRGQVAKSLDANSFAVMAAALAGAVIWGASIVRECGRVFRAMLGNAQAGARAPDQVYAWSLREAGDLVTALVPFLFAILVAGVLANVMQTGPVFSFHPVKPDFQRLNPATGFKRIYSMRALFEAGKSLAKLVLFTAVAYVAIAGLMTGLIGLMGASPTIYPFKVLGFAESVAFRLLLAFLIVVLLDLAYVRTDYAKRMRMSRREQKDEVKRREGDPHIRARRRELQREALKRSRSLQRVPEADVLITNPTHLAVALKYERGRFAAPRCIAKGAGEAAIQMRRIALRRRVQVVEERQLARQLFLAVEVDALIPESLYEPVARVYAQLAASGRVAAARPAVEVRA
jgi:flagellar biosynthesis protein FlhB